MNTNNNNVASRIAAIAKANGEAAPVMNAADRVKALMGKVKGGKAETFRNGDVLIQPEATIAGGKGKSGEAFIPVNDIEGGDGEMDGEILINDDEPECDGNCIEGEGEGKGKCTCENCKGKNGSGDGEGDGDGDGDGQEKDGGKDGSGSGDGDEQEKDGGKDGSGSGDGKDKKTDDKKPKFKVGDKVKVKSSGEEKTVAAINEDGSYLLA